MEITCHTFLHNCLARKIKFNTPIYLKPCRQEPGRHEKSFAPIFAGISIFKWSSLFLVGKNSPEVFVMLMTWWMNLTATFENVVALLCAILFLHIFRCLIGCVLRGWTAEGLQYASTNKRTNTDYCGHQVSSAERTACGFFCPRICEISALFYKKITFLTFCASPWLYPTTTFCGSTAKATCKWRAFAFVTLRQVVPDQENQTWTPESQN